MLLSDVANLLFASLLITGLYLVIKFINMPNQIAQKRNHSRSGLIKVLSWCGLISFGLLWVVALMVVLMPYDDSLKRIVKNLKKHPVSMIFHTVVIGIFVFSTFGVMQFVIPPQQTVDATLLEEASYQEAKLLGRIENDTIVEASGISRSHRRDDLFWVHNDSNNEELLYAVGLDGEDMGSFRIDGVTMNDWEAMASYEIDDIPYIVIADVGDNEGGRQYYNLYGVVEPEVVPGQGETNIDLAWHMRFQYEDGPRNCESMAIDETSNEILFISKYDVPHRLYSIPLPEVSSEVTDDLVEAKFVTEITTVPQPDIFETITHYPKGVNNGKTTSFDISADGKKAIVLTYTNAYIYERDVNEDWSNAFSRLPKKVAIPVRSEAAGFLNDNQTFFIIPEHGDVPLYRFDAMN
ncbi:DUF3302 domain-containing protein [Vallitalea okinawensis]|uniref:DUF3302 domain-containing protein n=1 Tax=Vallitalea okinawensis TaxID=2078660 RepID=UPI000CFACDDE|nr:DUF3302 domain-containing protein [Vallitalea okinawensis]